MEPFEHITYCCASIVESKQKFYCFVRIMKKSNEWKRNFSFPNDVLPTCLCFPPSVNFLNETDVFHFWRALDDDLDFGRRKTHRKLSVWGLYVLIKQVKKIFVRYSIAVLLTIKSRLQRFPFSFSFSLFGGQFSWEKKSTVHAIFWWKFCYVTECVWINAYFLTPVRHAVNNKSIYEIL